MIANMAKGTEIGRLLVWQAAALKNRGLRNTRETSLAKWHATEHSVQAALDAIQIRRRQRLLQRVPVERYLRNSKAAVIYEGTSQLHTLIQADYALGYRQDRPLRCEPWPATGSIAAGRVGGGSGLPISCPMPRPARGMAPGTASCRGTRASRLRAVTMSATARTMTAAATAVRAVSGSSRMSDPRTTATTGFTYA